ncbi:MAG TPA: divalent metal cation transporter, partial [Candidatus Limnocylindria bacterium]|nr:divalent metal cation transporter [Candidatus Limnocylindria bacterium]
AGAIAVLVTAAVAMGAHTGHGSFVDAGQVAAGLRQGIGGWAGAIFAIVLLNGSVLGAAAVTLSTSYALGDVFGTKHSLHRRWRDAPIFHGSFAISLVVAASIVLTPGAPLGVVTLGVQALAGVLLPSATVLLLLLCNDRTVLGPWVNPRWLNVIAVLVVGGLLETSALLMVTILRPGLSLAVAAVVLTVALSAGFGVYLALRPRSDPEPAFKGSPWERATWSMPQLEGLPPAPASMRRTLGLTVLRVYLLLAATLVAFRVVEAILGA